MINYGSIISTVAVRYQHYHFSWRSLFGGELTGPSWQLPSDRAKKETLIAYNLVVQNSGTIAAKNIHIRVADEAALSSAFGQEAVGKFKETGLRVSLRQIWCC